MDIAKIFEPIWTFKSATSGDWLVRQFSVGAMIALQEHLEEGGGEAEETIRCVMGEILYRSEQQTAGSKESKPTKNELSSFTSSEIEKFAQEYIEKNPRLADESEVPPYEQWQKSACEYLSEILTAETERQGQLFRKHMANLKERLDGLSGDIYPGLGQAVQGLKKQTDALAASRTLGRFGSIFSEHSAKLTRNYCGLPTGLTNDGDASRITKLAYDFAKNDPRPPHLESSPRPDFTHLIAENPAHKANDHLAEMNVRLENLISFGENALSIMHSLQVASAEFLKDFGREAKSNSNAAWRAIWVGFFAVMISIGQILYTEFWRSPQDSAAMRSAVASVRSDITDLMEAMQESAQADSVVEQGLSDLLEQQRVRDEALMKALSAIAASINSATE